MNKSKECIYCKDISTGMQFQPCYTCIAGSNFSLTAKVIKQPKPQSLLKKFWKEFNFKKARLKIKRSSVKRWWRAYIPISKCIKIQPYYFIVTITWN